MEGTDKKKVAIVGVTSILLVAMVVAVAVDITLKTAGDGEDTHKAAPATPTSVKKAVEAMCAPTDYRETCEQSLSGANSTDTKDLIKVAFDVTVQGIRDVVKTSKLWQEAEDDESIKESLSVCEEVLDSAIDDLGRSLDRVGELDISRVNEYIADVKTWLSAVITNQETCIDAFENTTGETGEKMKNLMKTVREMSSNGLAIVTDISSAVEQLQLGGLGTSRKLMSDSEPPRGWRRRLLESSATPNAVVALDGSGQFRSINDAINSAPDRNNKPFIVYVKEGLYEEYVQVNKTKTNVVLIGDGPEKTRITGNKNFADGVKTFRTATLAVEAFDFFAKDIGIENTAGPEKFQAVALRVSGDRAVFYNVHIDAYQDTLYAHSQRQYYQNCKISGTIDFVFGDSLSIFQKCRFVVRKPLSNQGCMVTAQGRVEHRSSGAIVIDDSAIEADPEFLAAEPAPKAYLGRPWKELSRTIIMKTNIGGFIAPEGWAPWNGDFALNTLYYAEYNNNGPGSSTSGRVNWKGIHQITPEIARRWSSTQAYGNDRWISNTGIPYSGIRLSYS